MKDNAPSRNGPNQQLRKIQVLWSEGDQEFVAVHPQFPSLSHLYPDRRKAKRGLQKLLRVVRADLRDEHGGEKPKS